MVAGLISLILSKGDNYRPLLIGLEGRLSELIKLCEMLPGIKEDLIVS